MLKLVQHLNDIALHKSQLYSPKSGVVSSILWAVTKGKRGCIVKNGYHSLLTVKECLFSVTFQLSLTETKKHLNTAMVNYVKTCSTFE